MDVKKKHWFKRRRYGYGWIPVTWQGWLILTGFVLVLLISGGRMPNEPSNEQLSWFMGIVLADTLLLIVTAMLTGPKPHWRWGKKDTDNPDEDF